MLEGAEVISFAERKLRSNPFAEICVGVDIGSGDIRVYFGIPNPETGQICGQIKFEGLDSCTAKLGAGISGGKGLIAERNLEAAGAYLKNVDRYIRDFGIPARHVCAVATEAVRADIAARGNRQTVLRLQEALGNRPIWVLSGVEEAHLLVETVKHELAGGLIKGAAPRENLVCWTYGGGSGQGAYYMQDGDKASCRLSMPCGVLPLMEALEKKGATIAKISQNYRHALKLNFPVEANQGVLCLGGGVMRTLGSLWLGVEGESDRDKMSAISRMKPKDLKRHGDYRIWKRADAIPVMAAVGLTTMEVTRTDRVHFLQTKMVEMLSRLTYDTQVSGLEPPSILKRLFFRSAPSQALRA